MIEANIKLPDIEENLIKLRTPAITELDTYRPIHVNPKQKNPSRAQLWARMNDHERCMLAQQQQNMELNRNMTTVLEYTRTFSFEQNQQWIKISNVHAQIKTELTTIKRHISMDVHQKRTSDFVRMVAGINEQFGELEKIIGEVKKVNFNDIDWKSILRTKMKELNIE